MYSTTTTTPNLLSCGKNRTFPVLRIAHTGAVISQQVSWHCLGDVVVAVSVVQGGVEVRSFPQETQCRVSP